MTVTRRYRFWRILKIMYPRTLSASLKVPRTSRKLCHRTPFTNAFDNETPSDVKALAPNRWKWNKQAERVGMKDEYEFIYAFASRLLQRNETLSVRHGLKLIRQVINALDDTNRASPHRIVSYLHFTCFRGTRQTVCRLHVKNPKPGCPGCRFVDLP
jgi:hypothetical protein